MSFGTTPRTSSRAGEALVEVVGVVLMAPSFGIR
jgi:hypothetical protein